jgi:hypothetical protein
MWSPVLDNGRLAHIVVVPSAEGGVHCGASNHIGQDISTARPAAHGPGKRLVGVRPPDR